MPDDSRARTEVGTIPDAAGIPMDNLAVLAPWASADQLTGMAQRYADAVSEHLPDGWTAHASGLVTAPYRHGVSEPVAAIRAAVDAVETDQIIDIVMADIV